MNTPLEVAATRGLLDELRGRDTRFRVFGAEKHRYELAPKCDEKEVLAFEGQHDVQLPAEYRDYMANIANGGAGPNYGVKPLTVAAIGFAPLEPFRVLGRPNQDTRETLDYSKIPGAIWLSDNGCGQLDSLVVNGEAHGKVWTFVEEDDYVRTDSFTAWYLGWLHSAINTIRREELLQEIRPGMSLAEVRGILGAESVNPDLSSDVASYCLGFQDCNACVRFSRLHAVLDVKHLSHVIVPQF